MKTGSTGCGVRSTCMDQGSLCTDQRALLDRNPHTDKHNTPKTCDVGITKNKLQKSHHMKAVIDLFIINYFYILFPVRIWEDFLKLGEEPLCCIVVVGIEPVFDSRLDCNDTQFIGI